jgi:hypothetical protein
VVGPFEVENMATVFRADSAGEYDLYSNVATVTIKEGILLDKFQSKSKHACVALTNFTGTPKVIDYISMEWPAANKELRQITLDGTVIGLVPRPV